MPAPGFEPGPAYAERILSPICLPIPSGGQLNLKTLQSLAFFSFYYGYVLAFSSFIRQVSSNVGPAVALFNHFHASDASGTLFSGCAA